jgi:hypothetical protein
MQVGDKVVCIDKEIIHWLSFGEIYTIDRIDPKHPGSDHPSLAAVLFLKEVNAGYFDWHFRLLEEMQNTNFIGLVQ